MRALVIDDSRAMRRILETILGEIGFDVVTAGHGKEGLEKLEENADFGLMLVDWNLPEMNGYEFVQAVRGSSEYDDIKVLMVTTETEIENVQKALDAGVDEYVMKPFTKATILEKLALVGIEPDA